MTEREAQDMLNWIWRCSPGVQQCMQRVPPASVVRARPDVQLQIPEPGATAFVYGYHEEPDGSVTALLVNDEYSGWAAPDWLEVVETYAGVDPDFIRNLLETRCAAPVATLAR